MGARQKQVLRPLSEAERHELQHVAKASSERVDTVKRAKALLAVADGKTFTQASPLSGLSREGVSQLVERFNQRGLAVLVIARGRGRKLTYHTEERACVLQEVQRQPDGKRIGKHRERRQRARLKRFAGSGAAIRSYASSLEIDPLSSCQILIFS